MSTIKPREPEEVVADLDALFGPDQPMTKKYGRATVMIDGQKTDIVIKASRTHYGEHGDIEYHLFGYFIGPDGRHTRPSSTFDIGINFDRSLKVYENKGIADLQKFIDEFCANFREDPSVQALAD